MDGRSLIQDAATHDAAERPHGRDGLPMGGFSMPAATVGGRHVA